MGIHHFLGMLRLVVNKKNKIKKNDAAIKQTAVMTQLNYRGFSFGRQK